MKKILFLDDDFGRFSILKKNHPDWEITWVQTDVVVDLARNFHYDEIWLDHDLSVYEYDLLSKNYRSINGTRICEELAKDPGFSIGTYIRIHSHNPIARENMYRILEKSCFWPIIEVTEF